MIDHDALDDEDDTPPRVEQTKFRKNPRFPHHRSDATHAQRGLARMEAIARKRARTRRDDD